MMTIDEAYDYAMGVVEDMRRAGVKVNITPSKSKNDPETVKKYSGPGRVSPDKWVHVEFHPEGDSQSLLIRENTKKLNWLGVTFDTGGMPGLRDWELDWSFRHTGKPDSDKEQAQDEVEDMIQGMEGAK